MDDSISSYILSSVGLITLMTVFGSMFYLFVLKHTDSSQKLPIYYFTLYFFLTAVAFISGMTRLVLPEVIAIAANNIFYILAAFCCRQGVMIRNGLNPPAVLKNKWLYVDLFVLVVIFEIVLFYYLDNNLPARIFASVINLSLIILNIAFAGFAHKKNKMTVIDSFLFYFLLAMAAINVLIAVIFNSIDIDSSYLYFSFILTTQMLQVFMWIVALMVVLLLDSAYGYYKSSVTDNLTKLYNRGYFTSYVQKKLATTDHPYEQKNESTHTNNNNALLFLDIDFFKKVNDSYGHAAGDLVIKTIGATIKTAVAEKGIVSRFGGEEFAVFYRATTKEEVLQFAEFIRTQVEQLTMSAEETEVKVTISIGVCMLSSTDVFSEKLKDADRALYQAKQEGRNRVCFL